MDSLLAAASAGTPFAVAQSTLAENSTAVLAVAVPLVVLLLLRLWRASNLDFYKIPQAPGQWPFLGILPDYWSYHDISAILLKYVEGAKAGPFVRTRAAHKRVLIVADPAAAAEVFSRSGANAVHRKVPEYASFDIATGLHGHHSILTEQDEPRWIAVRKALAPAYGTAAIRDNWPYIVNTYRTMGLRIAAVIDDAAAAARPAAAKAAAAGVPVITVVGRTDSDDSACDGDVAVAAGDGGDAAVAAAAPLAALPHEGPAADVHIDHLSLAASIQMQAEGLFRMPPDQRKRVDDLQIAHDLEDVIGVVHQYGVAPWNKLLHFALPWATEASRKMHPARRRLAAAFTVIYDHVMSCPPPEPGDTTLGACLRRLRDPHTGEAPSRERLLAEVGNQIMAPETAAHTLSWMLFCVATHPEVEVRLILELRGAGLACDGDLEAALTALEAKGPDALSPELMPYLNAVLNESMRMYPAGASASPRLTEKPTKVGPYMIPKGVMVFPCLYVINNWSGNWDDARKFKPERWLVSPGQPDPALDPASGAPRFLPFSSGPKACIGGALGLVAVRAAAAALLSTYSYRLAEHMGTPESVTSRTKLALTLKVDGGMWLNCARRTPAAAAALP